MLRVYVDTSVIGGCYDHEFKEESCRFFDYVDKNILRLLVSPIIFEELEYAPPQVQQVLKDVKLECIEYLELTDEVIALRNSYIKNGILSKKWVDDATHVALATINRADAIVSWNFRHIVRLDKIKLFNQINLLNGYGILTIITPREVYYE
ncbi:MAG: hypothetical protein RO257_08185 [Candidatus Kapabacteria bacterium]|nr:hypothetical protein [Candidatus Kapabacteria bacterium]